MQESTIIGADARMLLAQIYYQLERKTESLKCLKRRLPMLNPKIFLPKEGWWGLQRVLYYEKEQLPKRYQHS